MSTNPGHHHTATQRTQGALNQAQQTRAATRRAEIIGLSGLIALAVAYVLAMMTIQANLDALGWMGYIAAAAVTVSAAVALVLGGRVIDIAGLRGSVAAADRIAAGMIEQLAEADQMHTLSDEQIHRWITVLSRHRDRAITGDTSDPYARALDYLSSERVERALLDG